MVNVHFAPLTEPTQDIAETFTRWGNDPLLIPLIRPNKNREELEKHQPITTDDLVERLNVHRIYLIYREAQLVGEMSYQVDPAYLLKKERGTAWIGITIGEAHARGKGIGRQSLQYLEQQIVANGLAHIELGVFEFNMPARSLYRNMGYKEIGRIKDFTYWQDRMWEDIRMEKYL